MIDESTKMRDDYVHAMYMFGLIDVETSISMFRAALIYTSDWYWV